MDVGPPRAKLCFRQAATMPTKAEIFDEILLDLEALLPALSAGTLFGRVRTTGKSARPKKRVAGRCRNL